MQLSFFIINYGIIFMKKVFFTLFLTLAVYLLDIYQCFSNDNSDKIYRTFSKQNYNLRIYLFASPATCSLCNLNINQLFLYSKRNNCEQKVFVAGLNQVDAESYKEQMKFNCPVIGDENNIYTDYYDANDLPKIVVLDNKGKLLISGKLGGQEIAYSTLDSLLSINKFDSDKDSKLKEIERIQVTQDGKIHFTNHLREILYNKSKNNYVVRERAIAEFYLVDSAGNVFRNINHQTHKNLKGFKSSERMSWKIQDSILFFITKSFTDTTIIKYLHFYDVINDTIIRSQKISSILDSLNIAQYNDNIYQTNQNRFIMFYHPQFEDLPRRCRKLESSHHSVYVFDDNISFIKSYGSISKLFEKYSASKWHGYRFKLDQLNNLFLMEDFTKQLSKYNSEGELVFSKDLNLGQEFKQLAFDIPTKIPKDSVVIIRNALSFTTAIVYDEIKEQILISYFNEHTENNVETVSTYFMLFDKNGNALLQNAIIAPNQSIPFYMENGIVFSSEVNSSSQLEIVKYRIREQ